MRSAYLLRRDRKEWSIENLEVLLQEVCVPWIVVSCAVVEFGQINLRLLYAPESLGIWVVEPIDIVPVLRNWRSCRSCIKQHLKHITK